ncbi:MAG: histidine--tRNA ligase [Oscillospiraceae bacterium]|nr:histidine--tRNA ligase [Oscillospiraceae bacterium]
MERIKPRTLSGFMELLPPRQAQMDAVMRVLRETYALYGFASIDTPVIEAAEVLLAKGGGETEKQIYRFSKGDSDLALRFDLTVPLAKYVAANYGQLAFPFRRYQIGKVYRGERAQRGRFREFYQADIDIIGDGSLDVANEAELPAIICQVFQRLGLERFCIRMNNRKVLNGLFDYLGVADKAGAVMNAIDKLEKIGREKVSALLEEAGLTESTAAELLDILESPKPLEALEALYGRCGSLDEGIDALKTVVGLLPGLGAPEDKWRVDLTIARGLDYYTGTVYETTLLDYPEVGSVCSGGRYDNLAEYYTDKKLPGVGVSIGVTRLFYILQEQGLLSDDIPAAPCEALVIPMGDTMDYAVRCAGVLRAAGVRTQVYMEQKKVKAKFAYADKLSIPYAVVVGEDEKAAGTVSLKDLATGEQITVTAERAAMIINDSTDLTAKPVKGSGKKI